jgi:voltage-gated potassium channel Kch
MLLFCTWVAFVSERSTNPGFDTYGDSLWWGIVTLTTVGYGDIVPHTEKGRFAGVFLMITGVATLGLIAGTLAGAFGLDSSTDQPAATTPDASAAILDELAALRRQLDAIEHRLPSEET